MELIESEIKVGISARARAMQASPLRKLAALAEERKRKGVKVFHLNIGQPDLPTPDAVFEAIRNFDQKTIAYAPSNGLPTALSAWRRYFEHYGIEFEEKEMIVTTGGSEAIIFAMSAICDAGDEIIVFEPFYTNYNGFASIANVKLRPIPLSITNGFHLPSAEVIEQHVNSKTRGILICNPGNPTGTIYSEDEIRTLVDVAKKHHLFLLSDEVYREFAYDAEHVSIMKFPEIREQAILLDSCSKRFNVCGARIGVLASHNEEVIQAAFKFAMARLSVATIEQLALVPLLSSPAEYATPIVKEFQRRRDVVYDGLGKIPGVTFYKPEGAFYIIVGLPVKDSEHFARWLIEEYEDKGQTILLAPAQGFYATPGKGTNEVRLAFMVNVDDLRTCLSILRNALGDYRKLFS
ncbi:MAG TPA: pyridoxal phosphate-dependent aminotransferase [Bacteroidota bacterium]|nr:pyridoxal phosphate-dependent aminotransferase [Bacteroidota bacterium]